MFTGTASLGIWLTRFSAAVQLHFFEENDDFL